MNTNLLTKPIAFAAFLAMTTSASATVIDFTGGTVELNSGATTTTNNSAVHHDVASYVEDGFKFEFMFSSTPPPTFSSIIGDYYRTGNDVVHWHWDDAFGNVTEVRVSKVDGTTFDLGGFRVSTNTSKGGGSSTGGEQVSINTSKADSIFNVASDSWGLGAGPDPLITIADSNALFDDINWFSFTNDDLSTAVGMGLDNFFIDEAGEVGGTDPTVSVPEPGSLALLAAGLFGLRFSRRRAK